jgi:hypothetical protein
MTPGRLEYLGDALMTQWSSDELARIGSADELELAVLRPDGTLRKPVTIWVVRYGDNLYIRSVNGRSAAWFRATQVTHAGRIRAAGVEKDVTFAEPAGDIADDLDAAYRAKYHRYAASIVNSILTPAARAATLQLMAR